MKTSGKTVLITGGSSGIGLELARQLLSLGNTVLITGRDAGRLEQAQKDVPGLLTLRSDVSDPEAIRGLYAEVSVRFPTLDVLVNNAGIMRKLNLQTMDADLDALTREVETNLIAPMRMVKQFLPLLQSRPEAAILNVSSGLAFVPLAVSPVYSAAKAGLHSFTQSLRAQLKLTSIKVFELAAPVTGTSLLDAFDKEDLEGSPIMPVDQMVRLTLEAMRADRYEIRPGISNRLKLMSRVAPEFIFKQLAKSTDRMLATPPGLAARA